MTQRIRSAPAAADRWRWTGSELHSVFDFAWGIEYKLLDRLVVRDGARSDQSFVAA
ncbi:MAG: hypothetical protein HOP29_11785 [Phycisphaerales bacterium]|nr:hypothetical protein [Phycisphaerales bacterium]